jgi:hypothetical protein
MVHAISCSKRSRVILAGAIGKRDEWSRVAFAHQTLKRICYMHALALPAGNINCVMRRRELKEYAGVNVYITRRVAIFALKSRAENNNRSGGIGVTQAALRQENKNKRSRSSQATTR